MHRTALLFSTICFMLAAAASAFLATRAVTYIEDETQTQVESALLAAGQTWATTRADGLKLHLTGLAPNEAARLSAFEIIGQVIDSGRVEDRTTVLQSEDIHPPRFSLEVLRNTDRISLIGLIPERVGRDIILGRAQQIVGDGTVTDMLESAEYTVPAGWARNLEYGLNSLADLPRSKISITPDAVKVTAVTSSPEEKASVEAALKATKPEDMELVMEISAPRPVIAPFRFRMTMADGAIRLAACSADTRAARDRILRALRRNGMTEPGDCDIGLGVPTTDWDAAVIRSVEAVSALGGGTLTFTDSDVSLVAPDATQQDTFDRVIGALENSLPDLFSLQAVLPPKIKVDGGTTEQEAPEFVATRSPEGTVLLRGRLPNELAKDSVGAFASALFGADNVYNQTRIDEELPDGWPQRVLAGIQGLGRLHHGSVIVDPETVSLRGIAAREKAISDVAGLFAVEIGDAQGYKIDVQHDPKLLPKQDTKTSQLDALDCEIQIGAILKENQIQFAPSSSAIEAESQGVLDAIAETLRDCPDTEFEIEGHTDSQGSEDMNLALSQQRAEAVLTGLLSRRILISSLTARGFGEEQPIADNNTEDGRAANRRIAFRLLRDTEPEAEDTADIEEETDE